MYIFAINDRYVVSGLLHHHFFNIFNFFKRNIDVFIMNIIYKEVDKSIYYKFQYSKLYFHLSVRG